MYRKDIVQEIAVRLKKMRRSLGYSGPQMAEALNIRKSSYYRNEKGKTSPDLWTYYFLGKHFDVNVDWLICNRGEMKYKEKDASPKKKQELENLEPELIELIRHMKKIPSLHHELLARFHHFKDEHAALVERHMKE